MFDDFNVIINEIGDREQYRITVEFGVDLLVLSYQNNLDDALKYLRHPLKQEYNVRYELNKETANDSKTKEDLDKIRNYVDNLRKI